ncbi:13577_t:CDS:2 [Ambispora leptoticha]|uniref:13577_t:CDS:1 n=1 Tax=Ambispora leptoticha TaxID=144679 RepID=A0A9N9BPJ2_9GLOM|nr:13577_t:CDS:2 [Ambispora leptoticha]
MGAKFSKIFICSTPTKKSQSSYNSPTTNSKPTRTARSKNSSSTTNPKQTRSNYSSSSTTLTPIGGATEHYAGGGSFDRGGQLRHYKHYIRSNPHLSPKK